MPQASRHTAGSLAIACAGLLLAAALGADAQTLAPGAAGPENGFVIESRAIHVRVEHDGRGERELAMRVLVKSDLGVQIWGALAFGYDGATETLEFAQADVQKPDGRVVKAAAETVRDLAIQPGIDPRVFTDYRQKHLTVPAIQPGDRLLLRLVWKIHTPIVRGHTWFSHDFVSDAVVQSDVLEVTAPSRTRLLVWTRPGAPAMEPREERGGRLVHRWQTANAVPKPSPDLRQALLSGDLLASSPDVQMTTFSAWNDVAAWYADLSRGRAVANAEVRAKALELTRGLDTDDEKIRAIYDYVARTVRYVSLSFGIGRFAPRPAAEVLTNQYGDCKDKHTLLAALLSVVGVRAYPALASSSRTIDPSVPSPGQFDHLITVVPRGPDRSEWIWLDSTLEVAPAGMLAANIRGQQVLLIGPGTDGPHGGLVEAPGALPFEQRLTTTIEGEITPLGTLVATVTHDFRGDTELLMRIAVRPMSPEQRTELAKLLARESNLSGDVSDIVMSDPLDAQEPFRIGYRVRRWNALDWARPESSLMTVGAKTDFPAATEADWTTLDRLKLHELTWVSRSRIRLPKGYRATPPIDVQLARAFAEYRSGYRVQDDLLTVERSAVMKPWSVEKAQAPEYFAFANAIREDEKQAFRIAGEVSAVPAIPENATSNELYSAGYSAFQNGRHEAAIVLWKRITEIEPTHQTAWEAIGDVYAHMQQDEDAVAAYRQQIQHAPSHKSAHLSLAKALYRLKRYEESSSAYRQHLEINPLEVTALEWLGYAYLYSNKFEDAAATLERAASAVAGSSWLYLRLGEARLALGRKAEGAAALEKAVSLEATPDVLNSAAWSLVEREGDLDLARRWAEQAIAVIARRSESLTAENMTTRHLNDADTLAAVWDTLGWIIFKKGTARDALPYLHAAWDLAADPETAAHLGQVYDALGDRAKAAFSYASAIALWNGEPPADLRPSLRRVAGAAADLDALIAGQESLVLEERLIQLGAGPPGTNEAAYYLVVEPQRGIVDLRRAGGDERLRQLESAIRKARPRLTAPPGPAARLALYATVTCPAEAGGCALLIERPAFAPALDAEKK